MPVSLSVLSVIGYKFTIPLLIRVLQNQNYVPLKCVAVCYTKYKHNTHSQYSDSGPDLISLSMNLVLDPTINNYTILRV